MPDTLTAPTTELLDAAWDVHPNVSIRPESFGALLYHFGTRRLSFLKDRLLLDVVTFLPEHDTARSACLAAGLTEAQLPTYARALGTLVSTDMLVPRPAAPTSPGAHP